MKINLEPVMAVCLYHYLDESLKKLKQKPIPTFGESLLIESIENYKFQVDRAGLDPKKLMDQLDRLEHLKKNSDDISS
jgi:hypothetical protein